MNVLLCVLEYGSLDCKTLDFRVCRAMLRPHDDYIVKHHTVELWKNNEDRALCCVAARRRDSKLLLLASSALQHGLPKALWPFKDWLFGANDKTALHWVLQQQSGFPTKWIELSVQRDDQSMLEMLAQHCKDESPELAQNSPSDYERCWWAIANAAAKQNRWPLVEWALAQDVRLILRDTAQQAAMAGHAELLKCFLERTKPDFAECSIGWRFVCFESRQLPAVQKVLREAGCPCDCEGLAQRLEK